MRLTSLSTISLLLFAALLAGCTTEEIRYAHTVPLVSPQTPYPESQLLDVGVVVFDSGVPDGEIDRQVLEQLMRDGTFVQIRRAEAIFQAVKLRDTLEKSGHWGAVWVTPRASTAVDLNVQAQILQSDGNVFDLHVTAKDATGRTWLDKKYDMETAASAYNRQRYPDSDPYQDVFNEVANDLASIRADLDAEDVDDIRTIGEIRYASDLSPEAFGDYLEVDRDGVYEPVRLPAVDDPMLLRTEAVRQREQLLFETLDLHYDDFAAQATDSYDGWREYSREDSIELEEAARAAKIRTALGALAIASSIAYGSQSDNNSLADSIISNAGVYIGSDLLRSAAVRRQERRLHTQSLQELAASFDSDVKPLVVEVQGTQHRLTGTAEAQYREWQDLLKQLFISETGFAPEDIDIYAEPDSGAEDEAAPETTPQSAPAPNPAPANPGPEPQEATTDASGGPAQEA
jgi:hypothetical protein